MRAVPVNMALPTVRLTVDRDGNVAWNGSHQTRKTTIEWFGEAGRIDPQPNLDFGVREPDTPYKSVAPLLQAMHDNKAYRLGLITSRPYPEINWTTVIRCWTGPTDRPVSQTEDVVELAADGSARWNGEMVLRGELARMLDRSGRTTPQPLIVLKIDPQARFYDVTDLLYEITWLGIERIRFETD